MTHEIKSGDYVVSNGTYPRIEHYFTTPKEVTDVKPVPLDYAGNAIVFCMIDGNQIGFYINGLKKVN